jgi:ADP-ribosylglycohydrolase
VEDRNFELFTSKCRYTDDSVLTCATALALINIEWYIPRFEIYYKKWGNKYKNRGYGSMFKEWLENPDMISIKSYSNGVMMRCGPIGTFYRNYSLVQALEIAKRSSIYTHNSPESVRGVQSIVSAIHMAYNGKSKEEIRNFVEENFGHMLNITVDEARLIPKNTIRCNVTAPQALVAFMESTDYESAIRNAVYIGGDTDTNAAIAGMISEAFYGIESIPNSIIEHMYKVINKEMKAVISDFYKICNILPHAESTIIP